MEINKSSKLKRVQFLGSPFQGKGAEELKVRVKAHVESQQKASSSPQRLLIPFGLSAEEALAAVEAHLQTGKQVESQRKTSSPSKKEEWEVSVRLPQDKQMESVSKSNMNGQSPMKGIWENAKYFLGVVFFGFLYGVGFLALLAVLLTIGGVDISESDTSYRLLFLFWGVCTVGWHLYIKNQEEQKMR